MKKKPQIEINVSMPSDNRDHGIPRYCNGRPTHSKHFEITKLHGTEAVCIFGLCFSEKLFCQQNGLKALPADSFKVLERLTVLQENLKGTSEPTIS